MKSIGGRIASPEITINIKLRGSCAISLINAALARRKKPVDVLADTIEAICRDDLFDAVMDDARKSK